MEWETLGKHCCAQLSCLQQQSVSVSCCSEKNCGEGVNMVSLIMISYSASPPVLAVSGWNVLWGARKLFWFEQHKCKSLKNVKPSCKAVFEKENQEKIRKSGK